MNKNISIDNDASIFTNSKVKSSKDRISASRMMKGMALLLVLVMAVISIWLFSKVGYNSMTVEAAISVSTSISGLLLIAALFALTAGDHREISRSEIFFLLTILLLAFSLFFSELSWFLDGRPESIWAIHLTEILVVVFGYAMKLFFYGYLLHTVLANKREALKPLTIILFILFGLECLIAITNPLTGLMFTVDEYGYEVDGIFMFIVNSELLYSYWLLIFVWIFIAIFDGNRRKLENKKHDIEVADSVIKGILPKEGEDIKLNPEMQTLVDAHTIPEAMKLAEMLTRERVRRMSNMK